MHLKCPNRFERFLKLLRDAHEQTSSPENNLALADMETKVMDRIRTKEPVHAESGDWDFYQFVWKISPVSAGIIVGLTIWIVWFDFLFDFDMVGMLMDPALGIHLGQIIN